MAKKTTQKPTVKKKAKRTTKPPAGLTLRQRLLQTDDFETLAIHVQQWDETVHVRGMSARDTEAFEETLNVPAEGEDGEATQDLTNFRARLVVRCVVDADGGRIFQDEDAEALARRAQEEQQQTVAQSLHRADARRQGGAVDRCRERRDDHGADHGRRRVPDHSPHCDDARQDEQQPELRELGGLVA